MEASFAESDDGDGTGGTTGHQPAHRPGQRAHLATAAASTQDDQRVRTSLPEDDLGHPTLPHDGGYFQTGSNRSGVTGCFGGDTLSHLFRTCIPHVHRHPPEVDCGGGPVKSMQDSKGTLTAGCLGRGPLQSVPAVAVAIHRDQDGARVPVRWHTNDGFLRPPGRDHSRFGVRGLRPSEDLHVSSPAATSTSNPV